MYTYVYMCICVHMYICICVYIHIHRDRTILKSELRSIQLTWLTLTIKKSVTPPTRPASFGCICSRSITGLSG